MVSQSSQDQLIKLDRRGIAEVVFFFVSFFVTVRTTEEKAKDLCSKCKMHIVWVDLVLSLVD